MIAENISIETNANPENTSGKPTNL